MNPAHADPAHVDGERAETFANAGGWPGILGRLLSGCDLSAEEAACALGEVLTGAASAAQISAFVMGLRMKGETVEEMAGLVRSMLEHAEPLEVSGDLVDTCGTGGDRSGSVNVSTMAALVVAGGGAKVCKHGGRAASSAAGSADVLEALGVVIDLGPHEVARCIAEAGMGFCFAPRYHPAMRFAAPVRRELGIATVFNFLGPLANPARARHQVVGVSDPQMAEKMMGVLVANGTRRAIVAHGADGLDELSTTAPTTVLEVGGRSSSGGGGEGAREGAGAPAIRRYTVNAEDVGLRRATLDELRGGDAVENAEVVRRVLRGEQGAHRDIVVLNAAAGLVVAGLCDDLAAGVKKAETVIDEGHALGVLEALVRVSRDAAGSSSG